MIPIPPSVDLENDTFVHLIEFDFIEGPYRVTDASFDVYSSGILFESTNRLLSMSDPSNNTEMNTGEIGLTMSAADQFFVAIAEAGTYRYRKVRMFRMWIDENGIEKFTLELTWKYLTSHAIDDSPKQPTVTFAASDWSEKFLQSSNWRTTNAAQISRFPNDTNSFDYSAQAEEVFYWGTRA